MADPKVSGIYEIVNTANGKRYVGSAVNIAVRWRVHRRQLRKGNHHSHYLQASWAKHGEEAFTFRLMRECPKDDLLRCEQEAFDLLRPEYNVCVVAGSSTGRRLSDDTRKKIGEAHRGRKRGPRSDEHCRAISASLKGKTKAPEHQAALQSGRAKRVYTDEQKAILAERIRASYEAGTRSRDRSPEYREKIAAGLRGKTLSPEHRAKISAAATGKKRGPYKIKAEQT